MLEKKRISTKQKIWEIVEAVEHTDRPGKFYDWFDFFILTLIFLNVVAVIVETVEWIHDDLGVYLYWFEVFSVAVFSVEFILRVWSSQSQKKYEKPFWGRIKFMLTPMALVDLIAILPFFLTIFAFDLRFIRTIRLFRLFRVLKFVRYSQTLKLFGKVVRGKKEELIVTATIMFVLVILTSSFIYLAEHEAQPDKFTDIPTSMWWAIVTLTTVGYGDVFPVTPLGKVFAALIAVLGIGMFALPTGILGASFVEEIDKMKVKEKPCCPHCGKEI
ncbi:hypothetical protein BH20ACI4_BH20ACI4_33820 [soil metagenome]